MFLLLWNQLFLLPLTCDSPMLVQTRCVSPGPHLHPLNWPTSWCATHRWKMRKMLQSCRSLLQTMQWSWQVSSHLCLYLLTVSVSTVTVSTKLEPQERVPSSQVGVTKMKTATTRLEAELHIGYAALYILKAVVFIAILMSISLRSTTF